MSLPPAELSAACTARLLSGAAAPHEVASLARTVCELQEQALRSYQDQVARRARRLAGCESGLGRLRTVTNTAELVLRVCNELSRSCGLERVLLSRLEQDEWQPWRGNDTSASEEWFRAWSDRPTPLSELPLESTLARSHRPALVRRTAGRRVHPVIRAAGSSSFVVAPILPAGQVVGYFHADHGAGGRECDETDRDLLWAFTEGFAHLYERTALMGLLRDQRARIRQTLAAVTTDLERLTDAEIELMLAPDDPAVSRAASTVRPSDAGLAMLTRRERDILEIVAQGATNREIAERLVLSVDTVKTHVKHILAKLGAVNRSQAIAQYLSVEMPPRSG